MDSIANFKEQMDFYEAVPMCDKVSTPCTIAQFKKEVKSKELSIRDKLAKIIEDKAADF